LRYAAIDFAFALGFIERSELKEISSRKYSEGLPQTEAAKTCHSFWHTDVISLGKPYFIRLSGLDKTLV
jgi:hypothetical protein